MRKNIIVLFLIFIFLSACSASDQARETVEAPGTEPMHYESEAERKERVGIDDQTIGEQGGYIQSEQPHLKQVDRDQKYTDPYTNEESLLLTEQLNKLDDLAAVQVASSDDKIMVGVMLKDIDNHKQISDEQFAKQIESEIRTLLPDTDKEIIVFTQEAEWGEWKNLDSRIQPPN